MTTVTSPVNHSAAIQDAGVHIGRVLQALVDGVLFSTTDGKRYEGFSHEGDDIGSFTTADVNYATNFMKRRGVPIGKCKGLYGIGFTLAWQDWHPWT